jgi:hypothetical protein
MLELQDRAEAHDITILAAAGVAGHVAGNSRRTFASARTRCDDGRGLWHRLGAGMDH